MKFRFWHFVTDSREVTGLQDRRKVFVILILCGIAVFSVISFSIYSLLSHSITISVRSNPSGGTVYINGTNSGITPLQLNVEKGVFNIRIEKPNYVSKPDSFELRVFQEKKYIVEFELIEEKLRSRIDTTSLKLEPKLSASEYHPKKIDKSDKTNKISELGTIQIFSNPEGAEILINDETTEFRTPASIQVPLGTYRIRVNLKDHSSLEGDQVVSIMSKDQNRRLDFLLKPQSTPKVGTLNISTKPLQASIFVNGIEKGIGEVKDLKLPYGEYKITFQTLEGYRTPKLQNIIVSQSNPSLTLIGEYERLVSFGLFIDNKGTVKPVNLDFMTGVNLAENFIPDSRQGPEKKFDKESNTWIWEFGSGYANKNPSGTDAMQIKFSVPSNVDLKKLTLRLYGYATNRTFPFILSGSTKLNIDVNSKAIARSYTPSKNIDKNDAPGYDEWKIGNHLIEGENSIKIYLSDNSTTYYLLYKLTIQ